MRLYCILTAFANAITPIVVGSLVLIKGKSNSLYKTYVLACVAVFFWSVNYILWQFARSPELAIFYCRLLMVGAVAITVFYTHHLMLLLEQKRPTLLIVNYVFGIIFIGAALFTKLVVAGVRPALAFSYWPVAGPLYLPFLSIFGAIITFKLHLVYSLMRKSHGTRRSQLQYVFWATVLAYVGGSTNYPLWFGIQMPPYGNPGASIYLAITSYAILKHRLMDISVIVRKTLVYTAVMVILAAIYLSIITIFAKIFQGFTGNQTVFTSGIAACLITFFFQPLRKRVQTFVDTKFFRQYVDREEKLYELSREVITHNTPESMGNALMQVINETIHPKTGVLYLRSTGGSGFDRVSGTSVGDLPIKLDEDHILATYFRDHPQPFVCDMTPEDGRSYDTRTKNNREDAA